MSCWGGNPLPTGCHCCSALNHMEKTPVAREYLVLKDTQRSSHPNAAPFSNALVTYLVVELNLFAAHRPGGR